MSVSHCSESRSFLLSPCRHRHPIVAAFTPIVTKEFEYRRFWWSGALRNLIVERRRESELTRLYFSRGVVVVSRSYTAKTPFAVFYYFPASPSELHPRRRRRRLFPYSFSVLSPFEEISRLFQFPLILLADRRAPGVILYFIPRVSYSYVVYTDFERVSKSSVTAHI